MHFGYFGQKNTFSWRKNESKYFLPSFLFSFLSFFFFFFHITTLGHLPRWPYHGLRQVYAYCFVYFLLTPLFGLIVQLHIVFSFSFLLPTVVKLQWLCLCHCHPMSLSCGNFAPVGSLLVALRALSLAFWFLFLFLFVCTTMRFPLPSLSYHHRPRDGLAPLDFAPMVPWTVRHPSW